ncbi:MAG: HAD-IA family hydrolase [Spirochaetia bacterium]|nr:HAD-IA family hydrolase [Spirochaetia bacterium]
MDLNLSNKKLFIFDWDGTLADSIDLISSCLMDSFKELRLPELSPEKAKSIIGLGLIDALELLTPKASDHDRDLLLKAYKKYFMERSVSGIVMFPGVEELLLFLKNKSVKTAVATGKSRAGLERDLSNSNLRAYFHTTRTIDECNPKPDPHMIVDIMNELGCSAAETVMIGDTTYDLDMAENAGVDSLAITGGAHSSEILEKCNPLKYFSGLKDLSEYLMKGI